MSIILLVIAFFVLFFIGCTLATAVISLEAKDKAEQEYYTLENLEIMDAITKGDDEE